MPRRRPRRREPRIADAILDQLLAGADPKTAFDPNGLLDDLKKALAERALKPRWITLSLAKEEPATAATAMAVRRWSDTGKRDLQIPRDLYRRTVEMLDREAVRTSKVRCGAATGRPVPRLSGRAREWSDGRRAR